jgi:hypothetical protein
MSAPDNQEKSEQATQNTTKEGCIWSQQGLAQSHKLTERGLLNTA